MRKYITHFVMNTACGHRMANRKWSETKQQPSMLPGPAVPGYSLVSFHFLWAILYPQAVQVGLAVEYRNAMLHEVSSSLPHSRMWTVCWFRAISRIHRGRGAGGRGHPDNALPKFLKHVQAAHHHSAEVTDLFIGRRKSTKALALK